MESQISQIWARITAITLFNSSSRWRQTTVSGHQPSFNHMKAAAAYFLARSSAEALQAGSPQSSWLWKVEQERMQTEESWADPSHQPALSHHRPTADPVSLCTGCSDRFKITPQVQHYCQAVWNSPDSILVYPFWFLLLHVNNPQIRSADRRVLYCCTSVLTTFCSPQNWLRSDVFNVFPHCLYIFPCA